jgi:NAD(P)-dependent dehydrogenase (short-subunit alcohol dehydrogenase family)
MTRLEGRVAVITGGNSGIGLATARRFVDEGAYVVITGRRARELDIAVREIGRNIAAVQTDVAKLGDLDRLYAMIKQQKGRIDVLFANAGIGEFAELPEVSEQHFDRLFGVNVKGLLFTVQKALPLFRDGGAIILNASTAASSGDRALSVYSATKAAVRSFARSWAAELAPRKIRVNALSPGVTDTPGLRGLGRTEQESKQFMSKLAAAIPLGRVATPDEVATAALFLASNDSSFVTGVELFVDGGMKQV